MIKGVILATSLFLATGGAASAQEKLPDVIVATSDLDLSKSDDLRVLDRRLSWAVMSACPDGRGVAQRQAAQACRVAKRAELAPLRARAMARASTWEAVATAKR